MNYQRIYDQIIDRAQKENRVKEKGGTYYERHHIVPKCLGGEGSTHQWRTHPNIILLTAREHFLAHLLLVEIYPKEYRLKHAAWQMVFRHSETQSRSYKVSTRLYERLKLEKSKANAELLKGKTSPLKGRPSPLKGVPNLSAKGKAPWNKGIPNGNKGIKRPDVSEKNKKNTKPVLQFTKTGIPLQTWNSGAEASRNLNIDAANINACCKGNLKTAGGFIWKYSENN
jgi:hypothetical protein